MNRENPSHETSERWRKDPKNWRFGVFYFNTEDPRLLPPKRLLWTGWTVNFANRQSVLLLIIFLLVAIAVTVLVGLSA